MMILRSVGLCAFLALGIPMSTAAQILINEVDYDDVGGDDLEFVELINIGGSTVDLVAGGYELVLLNGNDGTPPPDTEYDRVDLTGSIPAGGFYVIAANDPNSTVTGADQGGVSASDGFGSVQNGSGDLVVLVTQSGGTDTLVDALAYEGVPGNPQETANGLSINFNAAPITTPSTVADAGDDANSVARQVGADTGVNDDDFILTARTPGAANGGALTATPISIDAFRAAAEDATLYEITGTATTIGNIFVNFRTHLFVQDASGTDGQSGVLVDASGPVGDALIIQPGDDVTIQGTRTSFEGEVECSAISVVRNGSGPEPTPLVITPADLTVANTPNIAAELATILGVTSPSSADAPLDLTTAGDGGNPFILETAAVGASTFPMSLSSNELFDPLNFPDAPWDVIGVVVVDDGEIADDSTSLSAGQGLLAPRQVTDIFPLTPVRGFELYR